METVFVGSENGDAKNSFVNESCKPFEMSDYYKYSTKYRSQKRGKVVASNNPNPGKILQEFLTNLRINMSYDMF